MKTTTFAFIAMLLPAAALAQMKSIDVKPGLWEVTATTEMSGMPTMAMPQIPPDKLAQLPPEQQARIQAMMKGGANGTPATNTMKSCITREQIEQGLSFQNDKACTSKIVSSTGSKQEIHTECTHGQVKTTGDINIERIDSGHIKGNATMTGVGNAKMGMKITFDSKFLSSDCGDVKPGAPPK
jgi:hypothetical protein